jgi:hypothetical protein
MRKLNAFVLCSCFLMAIGTGGPARTADAIVPEPDVPVPSEPQRGIWGAIAVAPAQGKHGFFWGADKREEAEAAALDYCENQAESRCELAIVFRNHRHWTDDDKSGFPYAHCAALVVDREKDGHFSRWGAASAETRAEAEKLASEKCGDSNSCKVREWVCT